MRFRTCFVLAAFVVVACAGKKPDAELPPDLVWVQRPDGTRSCETLEAEKIESVARALQEAGVTVYGSKHVHDGKMRAQVCGIPTGWMNAVQIRRGDQVKAAGLKLQAPEAPDEGVSGVKPASP